MIYYVFIWSEFYHFMHKEEPRQKSSVNVSYVPSDSSLGAFVAVVAEQFVAVSSFLKCLEVVYEEATLDYCLEYEHCIS